MPLNSDFWSAVGPLRMPRMGTELMAPLLYSLIRSLRPRTVIEAGMGYTTPFIARALADNLEDFNAEILQLETKLELWNEQQQVMAGQQKKAELNQLNWESLFSDPPLASPSYYCSQYKPVFYAIDKMTNKESSAPKVVDILRKLELLHVVEVHDSDFRSFLDQMNHQRPLFDFIWNDADGGGEVGFAELFMMLNPNGGVMILHDTLTSDEGLKMVGAVKQAQATKMSKDFEVINLLEPHKMCQSSATMVKRISGYKPKLFPSSMVEIEQEIKLFLATREKSRGISV